MLLPQVPEDLKPFILEQIEQATDFELIQTFLQSDIIFPEGTGRKFILKDHEDTNVKILMNDFLNVTMPDDSMQPLINKDVKIQIENSAKVKSGDIVVAALLFGCYASG